MNYLSLFSPQSTFDKSLKYAKNEELMISFANGYAWTHNIEGITMSQLFSLAGKVIYVNKQKDKENLHCNSIKP